MFVLLGLLSAGCGGDDSAGADIGDAGGAGEGSDVSDLDLDLDLGDAELEAAIEETLEELDNADGPNPDSPYAGIRIWTGGGVEELLPGQLPDNLAPNPVDEFSFEGPRFEYTDYLAGQPSGDRHVNLLVADADWQWAVEARGVRMSRSEYATAEVTHSVEAESLLADGSIVSIAGDADAIFVGVDSPSGEDVVVEVDPASGQERGRVVLSEGISPLYSLDSNAEFVSAGRRDAPGDEVIDVIDRDSLEIAFSVLSGTGLPSAMLTDSELVLVSKSGSTRDPDTMARYSLADGSLLEDDITLPGNTTTRSFGDHVFQFGENDGSVGFSAVAGEHAATIAQAMPAGDFRVFSVDDVLFGDGFAVVSGCCADDEYGDPSYSLFVVDLASGTTVLFSDYGGATPTVLTLPA